MEERHNNLGLSLNKVTGRLDVIEAKVRLQDGYNRGCIF